MALISIQNTDVRVSSARMRIVSNMNYNYLWEDKEVQFDLPIFKLKMRGGEKILDRLDSIEDTKGNGGDIGRLIISNLRVIWHSLSMPRINLSIGYNCIVTTTVRTVNSKLLGTTEALHVLTKSNNSRFEFIFTNLILGNSRHLTSVMGVHKAYTSTRLYRELKLRSSIVSGKKLKILPLEQIVTTVNGAWNLSSDQGNLGTFIFTNVRIVWFADMNENFNLSLPYLLIAYIKIRQSKFGTALVVETAESCGGYVLGFRIDPPERLQRVCHELNSLFKVYSQNPIFGVEYTIRDQAPVPDSAPVFTDDIDEVDDTSDCMSNAFAAYFATDHHVDRPPVYCPELGLAIEKPKDGFSIQMLWDVIPN